MTTRQSVYVHLFLLVVAVGLLLITGTRMVLAAPTKPTPKQCNTELQTCQANLGTCNTNLSQAQNERDTCNSNLSTCNAGRATCDTSLSTCNAGRATCNTSLSACETDLEACESQPAATAFPATGQTTSYRLGDDGDIEAGATLSYTDNGDGTITDNNTGLQWEKKSRDGSSHDIFLIFSWEDAFAVHVAGLNTASFAGHTDWRLPNYKELTSILNLEISGSAAVSPEFNNNCEPGVTVLDGSCTSGVVHWSSTTTAGSLEAEAWVVQPDGRAVPFDKRSRFPVRAVRGGSP